MLFPLGRKVQKVLRFGSSAARQFFICPLSESGRVLEAPLHLNFLSTHTQTLGYFMWISAAGNCIIRKIVAISCCLRYH